MTIKVSDLPVASILNDADLLYIVQSGVSKKLASSSSGLVPKTTTVNSKALSSNIVLSPTDIGSPSGSGTSSGTNTGDQDLTPYAKIDGSRAITGKIQINCVYAPVIVVTYGSTSTLNLSLGNYFELTMTGSPILALSNGTDGEVWILELIQGGSGSNTVTWWSGILWPDGTAPTLTTTVGKRDVFSFVRKSSGVILGFTLGQNL